jgi:predicted esterase YcpF (UPF0227 family)
MTDHLCIYVHGFNSSGSASKAMQLREALQGSAVQFESPNLSHHPSDALKQLHTLIDEINPKQLSLVGSSLGGFYSAILSERYPDARIVLINPAIKPWIGFEQFLGEHINPATGEKFCVIEQDVDEIKEYAIETIVRPGRFLLLLQTDDDVVDYRIAQTEFSDSKQIIGSGGGHRFAHFESVLPEVIAFLKV